jgi:hypothetical protein
MFEKVSAAAAVDARARLDRAEAIRIAAWALIFRVASAILALLVKLAFNPDRHMTVFERPSPFWDAFALGDSGWYEPIAREGYKYYVDSRCNIAFFPGYPLAMRYVGRLFGSGHEAYFLGGIVVSWASFVLAMVVLYYLARLDLPPLRARRAVLLTAVFPFAFFFGVVYTESMFLLTAVLAFYAFRTRRWLIGGLSASIAIATRVPGFLIWPSLAWMAWKYAQPTVRDRTAAAGALLLAMTGFAAYCAYIYSLSGHPFEWVATIQKWDYHPGGAPWVAPLRLLEHLFTRPYAYLVADQNAVYDTLYGLTGIVFLALTPFVWRRFGGAYAIYVLFSLLLPFSSGVFEGIGRYCSVLFPAFLWMASIRSRHVSTALLVLFPMMYLLGFSLFLTNRPIF